MAQWTLLFRVARPVTLEALAAAAAAAVGGPAAIAISPVDGDDRDGYGRWVTIAAEGPGRAVHLELSVRQGMRGPEDPMDPASVGGTLQGALFAAKLAAWQSLRAATAAIGCEDTTLAWQPAPLVDEAIAAGDPATAARLRAEITAALVAAAHNAYGVSLTATRADLPTVLAAYNRAPEIGRALFADCELPVLPADFASRFPSLEDLSWTDAALAPAALRGLALPKLTRLHLSSPRLSALGRAELAGFPALEQLVVPNTPLAALAADIVESCPSLTSVTIENTPLAADAAALASLRARWPHVIWS